MNFEVKAAADRQGIQTVSNIISRTTLLMQNRIPRILFLGGGLALVIFKGIRPWTGKIVSYETFCIITGITLVLLGVFGERINGWNAWRLARRVRGETRLRFQEYNFMLEREGKAAPHSYESIFALYQIPEGFVVFLTAKEGYLLRKSDFQTGNPLLFAEFLEKRQKRRFETLETKH